MKFEELRALGREIEEIFNRRPELAGEQQKLDERRTRLDGLVQELKDDQRNLNDRRRDDAARLKAIRREIAGGRKAFTRDQRDDAKDFGDLARHIEDSLDRAQDETDE